MIKSFRGKLADQEQDTIRLGTNQGLIGYRIVKFEIMSQEPYGGANAEHLVQLWANEQSTITADVDFDNSELLGTAIINNAAAGYNYASIPTIIFDNVIFNQDIYITHNDGQSTQACNYHLELEQVKLDLSEATVATLKDMRGTE